jgi:hypothetical protein
MAVYFQAVCIIARYLDAISGSTNFHGVIPSISVKVTAIPHQE